MTEHLILGWSIENPGKASHLVVNLGFNRVTGNALSRAACGSKRVAGSVFSPNRWPDNRTCKSCLKTNAAKVWMGITPKARR